MLMRGAEINFCWSNGKVTVITGCKAGENIEFVQEM